MYPHIAERCRDATPAYTYARGGQNTICLMITEVASWAGASAGMRGKEVAENIREAGHHHWSDPDYAWVLTSELEKWSGTLVHWILTGEE